MGVYDHERVKGFLHANGRCLVNADGEEVLPIGWAMGNWDNPEGFMIGSVSGFNIGAPGELQPMERMDRGRSLENIVRETCGSSYAASFRKRWHRAFLAEEDIRHLANCGYNSVRLPIRANSFLFEEPGICFNEEMFAYLDEILGWCGTYGLYAIIDVHAATAGQSCLPCDDGVDNFPHFFDDEEAEERMHLLLEEFARRYADDVRIGAYDFMNEPLSVTPRLAELTPVLKRFYKEAVRRFRRFDKNHLLLLNGTQFSSNVQIFDENFDPECNNWGIAIHMYSMVSPEMISIADVLDCSERLNIPVWMGETGSYQAYAWQTTMYEILAEHHIGFNIWCFKVCGEANCAAALRYTAPEGWTEIVNYASKGSGKPSYARAQAIFDAYLEAVRFENCTRDDGYYPYQLRKGSYEIPAIGYNDLPVASRTGGRVRPSSAAYRLSDGTDIVWEKDFYPVMPMPGMPIPDGGRERMQLRLIEGKQVAYTLRNTGKYAVYLACAADEPSVLLLTDGDGVQVTVNVPESERRTDLNGGPNIMPVVYAGTFEGEKVLGVKAVSGCVYLSEIRVREE